MTRQDYVKFAAMFNMMLAKADTDEREVIHSVIDAMADVLAQENPAFKRSVFLAACYKGIEQ